MAAAWWERRVSGWTCLRVWAVSWVGNFVGAALFVGLMVAAGSFERKEAFALILAGKKVRRGLVSRCVALRLVWGQQRVAAGVSVCCLLPMRLQALTTAPTLLPFTTKQHQHHRKQTHHSFGQCFVLGIFCNWLVCLATWMSCAAQDMAGKFVAIWLPISAFVMVRGLLGLLVSLWNARLWTGWAQTVDRRARAHADL